MLKIEIKTGGAAYSEDDVLTTEGRYELQRNLMDICRKITNEYDEGYIMDINGNKVALWLLINPISMSYFIAIFVPKA